MAPMLYHGLAAFGLPVVCIESRQAYQALKSLATPKDQAVAAIDADIKKMPNASTVCRG
ncbi:putative negative regulator of RcsB-dependent stress response [Sinorhizobium fredii]